MKNKQEIIDWLLEGDVSIKYQVYRDLLGENIGELQKKILDEGWGHQFLREQNKDGHWGLGFYQPKWTSTHYTLLDLRNLCIPPDHKRILKIISKIAEEEKGIDGGIDPSRTVKQSDVCINGMFLNYACYFNTKEGSLKSIIDFILSQIMVDGGFNCQLNRSGARHSSMHTTISTLEGFYEYEKNGYSYRLEEVISARKSAEQFLLDHKLYKSDKTGEIINDSFLKIPYPSRWYYDILRALDYFRYSGKSSEDALVPAIDRLMCLKKPNGKWKLNAKYPGNIHFEMEKAGKESRWNTLRAMRVLKYFEISF